MTEYQQYYAKNKEKEKARIKVYREKNPEKVLEWERARYKKHHRKRLESSKRSHAKHSEKIKKYQKAYRAAHKEKNRTYQKEYRIINRVILNEKRSTKRRNDPLLKLIRNVSSGISRCLTGITKGKCRHLDYSVKQLKAHLESRFQPGMTWDNYGIRGWHVDHVIPLKFKEDGHFYWNQQELANPKSETFKKAWSLNNLTPMWAFDNISKSNKFKG